MIAPLPFRSLAFATLVACAGCVSVPPPVAVDASADPMAAWARLLQKHVDDRGRINFVAMYDDRTDLDTFVAWVARVSPRSNPGRFPTRDERIAYYINSYNALAMYNHVQTRTLPEDKVTFFGLQKLTIGGEEISLNGYENDVIRKEGEPRVHFALNCIVRDCPRLPRVPFAADRLDAQLDAATREFMNSDRKVRVIPGEKKVLHSKILEWYQDDFVAVAPSVLDYINRYRTEKIPADFALESVDYDFTLNAW